MVKRTLTKERKQYYTQMWVYKKRREVLLKSAVSMTKKIKSWNYAITRIDKTEERIKNIAQGVKEFTGFSVKYSRNQKGKNADISKKLFYKYGISAGIRVMHLHEYIGDETKYDNKKFAKKLHRDSELIEIWPRFKKFMFQR